MRTSECLYPSTKASCRRPTGPALAHILKHCLLVRLFLHVARFQLVVLVGVVKCPTAPLMRLRVVGTGKSGRVQAGVVPLRRSRRSRCRSCSRMLRPNTSTWHDVDVQLGFGVQRSRTSYHGRRREAPQSPIVRSWICFNVRIYFVHSRVGAEKCQCRRRFPSPQSYSESLVVSPQTPYELLQAGILIVKANKLRCLFRNAFLQLIVNTQSTPSAPQSDE